MEWIRQCGHTGWTFEIPRPILQKEDGGHGWTVNTRWDTPPNTIPITPIHMVDIENVKLWRKL